MHVLIFLCLPALASAQLEQGRWLVGGNLGGANFAINEQQSINTGTSTFTRTFSNIGIGVGANLGYFTSNNLLLGGRANISFNAAGGENFAAMSSTLGLGVGPFLRYYFLNFSPSAALFGGVSVNYFLSTSLDTPTFSSHDIRPALSLGYAWFVSRDVALEFSLSYERRFFSTGQRILTTPPGSSFVVSPTYSVNTGLLSLNLGFQIFLDKVF